MGSSKKTLSVCKKARVSDISSCVTLCTVSTENYHVFMSCDVIELGLFYGT